MSTFAVFGMTETVALASAQKKIKTNRPNGKIGCLSPLDLPLEEWNEAVQHNAEAIMVAEKVRRISTLFDTPQHVAI
ncbi:hypothetical protein ACI2KD_07660 [Pseudomonas monteilii]